MKKYVTYTVQIPIEEGGELHKRLEAVAEQKGCSVQRVVDAVVQLGVYGHMEGNLALYEKSPGRCRN